MIYRLELSILSQIKYIQKCIDCKHEVKKENRYWECSKNSSSHYKGASKCFFYARKFWKFPKKLYTMAEICQDCVMAQWDKSHTRVDWCDPVFYDSPDIDFVNGTCSSERPFSTCCHKCGKTRTGKQTKFCSDRCRKKVASKRWRQKDNKKRRARILKNRAILKAKRKALINESLRKK